jgi:hypothetical protein
MKPSDIEALAKTLVSDSDVPPSRAAAFLRGGGDERELEALATEIALGKLWRQRFYKSDRRAQASLLLVVAMMQRKETSIPIVWGTVGDSLIRAKLTARWFQQTGSFGLVAYLIELATARNDKQFFVDLGKCLSGEIKDSTLFDKRERDIAEIVLFNPQMSAKDAVRELQKRGHRRITEENFRMWKTRLLKAKPVFDAVMARIA